MTTTLRRRHLLLTTGIAVLLGACSGASGPAATTSPNGAAAAPSGGAPTPGATGTTSPAVGTSPAAGASDACRLLTKAEVEAAFHETMLEPVSSVVHGGPSCTYEHTAGGGDLTVKISSSASSAAALKGVEGAYGAAATDLSGVGDAAFEFGGILIQFVKGTTLVTMASGDGPAIRSDDDFRALAKTVAGRV